jgi:hypothetical protein
MSEFHAATSAGSAPIGGGAMPASNGARPGGTGAPASPWTVARSNWRTAGVVQLFFACTVLPPYGKGQIRQFFQGMDGDKVPRPGVAWPNVPRWDGGGLRSVIDDRTGLPRTMLPDFHGGERGWFKLKNVVADARSVQASTNLGMLNNPKIYIDRMTGIITISGKAGDYSGQCQAVTADAPARF